MQISAVMCAITILIVAAHSLSPGQLSDILHFEIYGALFRNMFHGDWI